MERRKEAISCSCSLNKHFHWHFMISQLTDVILSVTKTRYTQQTPICATKSVPSTNKHIGFEHDCIQFGPDLNECLAKLAYLKLKPLDLPSSF